MQHILQIGTKVRQSERLTKYIDSPRKRHRANCLTGKIVDLEFRSTERSRKAGELPIVYCVIQWDGSSAYRGFHTTYHEDNLEVAS